MNQQIEIGNLDQRPEPQKHTMLSSHVFALALFLSLTVNITLFIYLRAIIFQNQAVPSSLSPALVETGIPSVSPTGEATSTPTPVEISAMPTASPTPSVQIIRSARCPVTFTVPTSLVYLPKEHQDGIWRLTDRSNERFMFLPRAEETNGREAELELMPKERQSYNGAGAVSVHCQDNPNKWNTDNLLEYALKSDIYTNTPTYSKIQMWGRDVYRLSYQTYFNDPAGGIVWIFATPGALIHVQEIYYTGDFRSQVDDVFNSLKFQ